jgi:UPF0716 protein FxsA
MFLLALFVALISITLLELYVVITVGEAIGVLPTIGIMFLDAAFGASLMRAQGRAVWLRFRQELAAGHLPAREALDGVLVIAGGAFLITPGFVTDLIGAFLLLPPTRAIARRLVVRRLGSRLSLAGSFAASPFGMRGRPAQDPPSARSARSGSSAGAQAPSSDDIEGTAVELDREELEP